MFPSALRPDYKHLIGITHTKERDGSRYHHLDVRFVRSAYTGIKNFAHQALLDDILYHNANAIIPIPVFGQGDFLAQQNIPSSSSCFDYFFIGTEHSPPLMVLKNIKQFFVHPHHTPYLSVMPNTPHDLSVVVREEGLLHENTFLDAVVSGQVEEYLTLVQHYHSHNQQHPNTQRTPPIIL